jgi:hypothetical protein
LVQTGPVVHDMKKKKLKLEKDTEDVQTFEDEQR